MSPPDPRDEREEARATDPRQPVGGELILPVAGLAFVLYYFSTILNSPWEAQVAAFFVGFILIGLILAFLARTGWSFARGAARLDLSPLYRPADVNLKRLALLALTLAYVVAIPRLGFTLTSFLYLACAIVLLQRERRPGVAVAVAGAVALGGYLLFVVAFGVRFPRGPFEELMRGLF